MTDEITVAVQDEIEKIPVLQTELSRTLRRGHVLRWRARLGAGASIAGLLALAWAILGTGPLLVGDENQQGKSSLAGAPSQSEATPSPEDASSLALRGLTQIGLREPRGIYYDYLGTQPAEGGWAVQFRATDCSAAVSGGECDHDLGQAEVQIEVRGNEVVITGATGRFTDSDRAALKGKRATAGGSPKQVFSIIEIVRNSDKGVLYASTYWTGPIGSSSYTSDCHVEVRNSAGEVEYKGRNIDFESPTIEGARDGVFGSVFPADVDASDAAVVCTEWQPTSPSS